MFIKVSSYYGLLSTSPITNPVPTGKMINLPIHSACMFAAYPGRSKEEVKMSFDWLIKMIFYSLKAGTVHHYTERPQFLAYHEKALHIMDLKPCQCPQVSFGSVDDVISRCNSNYYCNHGQKILFDTRNAVIMVLKKSKYYLSIINIQIDPICGWLRLETDFYCWLWWWSSWEAI